MKVRIFLVFMFAVFYSFTLFCTDIEGITGKRVTVDSSEAISLMVGGHLYGVTNSGYPASTLIANIDSINLSGADFFVSLGDLFIDLEDDLLTYRKSFFEKINIPVFNAVGNHDLSQPDLYYKEFGPTYSYFILKSNCFIILDTELNNGNIVGNQLSFLKKALQEIKKKNIKSIFFFSHRPIWMSKYPEIINLFKGADLGVLLNFSDKIYPLLEPIESDIYWLSGSMGGDSRESFFSYKEKKIHYILTAIRDRKNDGLLKIDINPVGEVTLQTVSLCNKQLKAFETYHVGYWKSIKGAINFSWPVLKYQVKRAVSHYLFWTGGITFLLIVFLFKGIFYYLKHAQFYKKV